MKAAMGVLFLTLSALNTVEARPGAVAASVERINRAQASSNAPEIVKIAREFADEILAAHEAPRRVTAAVVGLFRKAEALQAESITPKDAGRIGRLYLMLSESYADAAKRYLERSVPETGKESERVALGNAYLYLGRPKDARREYLKVSENRPQDPVLLVNIALAERALGDTPSAYGRLRQAMTKTSNPSVERAAGLAIAEIQFLSGDLSGAKLQAMKVAEKWPHDVEALWMLKKIYDREGRTDLAKDMDRRLSALGVRTSVAAGAGKITRQNRKGDQK